MFKKLIKKIVPTESNYLGLDISGNSAKFVQLSCRGNHYRLESYGVLSLEQVDLPTAIRQAGHSFIKPATKVAIAIPTTAVIRKVIQVEPHYTDRELEDLINLDIERYIPYSSDEISWDFQVIKRTTKGMDVLLVASRRELIEKTLAEISAAGLKVQIVDVEAFAMERAYKMFVKQSGIYADRQFIAIINIHSAAMTIIVLVEDDVVFTHSEELEQLTNAAIGLQLQRAFQIFLAKHPKNIQQIFLAGELSLLVDLVQQLEAMLMIQIIVINPFLKMELATQISREELSKVAHKLLVCCGLALRGSSHG